MILSAKAIQKLISKDKIRIDPEAQFKEASFKVHFSESLTVKPKEFITSPSQETIELPVNIAGLYDGYTHLSRQGIMTHLGSMFIDPGFKGQITLEIFNASNNEITIRAGDRAGHIIFLEVKD